jgi:rod shape-determining protein MreC
MPIYSVGRRRVIIALLLTSALLLTLDLRGNPVIDTARDVSKRVMQPIENATEAVTNPIERAWKGIVDYDDLERENQALQDRIDRLEGTQASAEASVIEYQELLALNNLPSLAGIETEVAQVVAYSSNNLDQVVEINKGSDDGIAIGMPVVNQAGLIGRVTQTFSTTSRVMLVTDRQYGVAIKVTAGLPCEDEDGEEPVNTAPSGLTEDEIEDLSTTSTTTTTTTPPSTTTPDELDPSTVVTDSTLPGGAPTTTIDLSELADLTDEERAALEDVLASGSLPETTTTTTTTTLPENVGKEFGLLEGRGGDRLPQVRFVQDNPALAELQVCDLVETAGGSESLAPPDIPVGRVANRADRPGSGGPLLDVELYADLDRLNYVRVVLYRPLSEVEQQ